MGEESASLREGFSAVDPERVARLTGEFEAPRDPLDGAELTPESVAVGVSAAIEVQRGAVGTGSESRATLKADVDADADV